MAAKSITSFTNEYAFLGNGYPSAIRIGDYEAPTVEHGFHMLKTTDAKEREWVLSAPRPFGKDGAKTRGRRVTLRPAWDHPCRPDCGFPKGMLLKEAVMLFLLRQKFTIPDLAQRLLLTYDWDLEEGNQHGDTFWGTVDGAGWNRLGYLLVQVRSELRVVYDFND